MPIYEYVQAGLIVNESKNFHYWKLQQKEVVINAHAISVVSNSMIDYFKKIANTDVYYCPILIDSNSLKFSLKFRKVYRDKLNLLQNNVYVYSGSFGLYGLNKTYLSQLIRIIMENDSKAKFLFLLSNSEKEFNDFIYSNNFSADLFIYKTSVFENLFKYLSAADVGIHALPKQMDSNTRLGTKIVEYWACGLPTLINNHVGEAASISSTKNFGKVIDLSLDKFNLDFSFFDRNKIEIESKAIFDLKSLIDKYMKIYNSI